MALSMFSFVYLFFLNDWSGLLLKNFHIQCPTLGLLCFEHGCYQGFSDDISTQSAQSVLSLNNCLSDMPMVIKCVCVWFLLIRLWRLYGIYPWQLRFLLSKPQCNVCGRSIIQSMRFSCGSMQGIYGACCMQKGLIILCASCWWTGGFQRNGS